jgi:serine/threonine protein kinase
MPLEELRSGDPHQLGPYRLLGRLGNGGMGRVFLGRSPGGRLVAVKVIRTELADNADFRERFAREVAAARRVSGFLIQTKNGSGLPGTFSTNEGRSSRTPGRRRSRYRALGRLQ